MLYFQLEEQTLQGSVYEVAQAKILTSLGSLPKMGTHFCPVYTVNAKLLVGGNSVTKRRMKTSPPLLS